MIKSITIRFRSNGATTVGHTFLRDDPYMSVIELNQADAVRHAGQTANALIAACRAQVAVFTAFGVAPNRRTLELAEEFTMVAVEMSINDGEWTEVTP